ncbi:MAG TPA: hypothetical protein VME42_02320 [Steroidobacteraceae bacterium]|nr:hypothetical protein [Steroidobacteraceae bacterium]
MSHRILAGLLAALALAGAARGMILGGTERRRCRAAERIRR